MAVVIIFMIRFFIEDFVLMSLFRFVLRHVAWLALVVCVSVHAQKNCNWEELQNHAPEIRPGVNTIMKGFLDNVTRQP